jgi:hypothetical protein
MTPVTSDDVARLAAVVGLPISSADLPNVAVALTVLLGAAELVTEFPLADDVEAAPVFRP